MKSRYILATIAVLVAMMLAVSGCGGSSDDGGTETSKILNRTVFVNPTDSMLYSFVTDSGEQLTYFGRRDEYGLASVITMLDYVDAAGDTYVIYFDNQGLPAKVVDENGTTVELEYNFTNNTATSERKSPASDNGMMSIESVGVTVTTRTGDIPSEVRTSFRLDEPVTVAQSQAIEGANAEEPVGNITIDVAKCNEPINPGGAVTVNVRDRVHSSYTRQYPAYPTSQTGRFVSWIPQRSLSPIPATTEEICTAFADKLNEVCVVFDPVVSGPGAVLLSNPFFQAALCGQVALAVTPLTTPAGGAAAGVACGALLAGGTVACGTLGFSTHSTPDADNVMQMLCGQVEETMNSIDSFVGLDEYAIRAVADFSKGNGSTWNVPGEDPWVFISEEQVVSSYGPFPVLSINSFKPTIDELTTFPSKPEAGQEYSTTANFSCVLGTDLSISVSRDGNPLTYEHKYGTLDNMNISVSVPDEPMGKVDFLLVKVINEVTMQSVEKKLHVEFEADQTELVYPLQYKGTGTSTDSKYNHSLYEDTSCPSTATWEIILYESGYLNGNYLNTDPQVPYMGQCVDSSAEEHRIFFSGTHSDGHFEITDSNLYYDNTNSPFRGAGTKIEGSYDANNIYTNPDYRYEDDFWSWLDILEHEFNILSVPQE